MYESFFRGRVPESEEERRAAVTYHQGSALDFLNRHNEDAHCAVRAGVRGVRELAPYLFQRIADARTLRLAWDYLSHRGGQASGPNGRRYRDYSSAEVWEFCRCLADVIRRGDYQPGPERIIHINKTSGHGQRPIVLLNIADRVVQRAIVLILQPVFDELFVEYSFGYRPHLGHLHALARAEHLTLSQRRRVWIAEDVKDAFQHVPLQRLLQTIEKFLPDKQLLNLLEIVLPGEHLTGLRQGGSLSPLMLNWYLHYFLDHPWRRDCPQIPLIRFADDLLAVCRSNKQALQAHEQLSRFLIPAGMPLKGTPDTAIHDLASGETVDWLGFVVCQVGKVLAAGIADRSWDSLEKNLALAQTQEDSSLRAYDLVRQWLNYRGPCFAWSDRQQVCQQIVNIAQAYAFEEVPGVPDLLKGWQTAYARWCKLRASTRQKSPQTEGAR